MNRLLKLTIAVVLTFSFAFPSLAATEQELQVFAAGMKYVQDDLARRYDNLEDRVSLMNPEDVRRDGAKSLLKVAAGPVNVFKALDIATNIVDLPGEPLRASDDWLAAERDAQNALTEVNRFMLSPVRPANVPTGDVFTDFVPQLIRTLFRFASLVILISLVASAIMMVIAWGNEEQITKARNVLLYSSIGFVFIALAFAIVKAVTDIDFFGFI